MKVQARDYIVGCVIKNLLRTQHVAAEKGDCCGATKVTKLLVKMAKKYGNNVIDFSSVNGNEEYSHPPDDGY